MCNLNVYNPWKIEKKWQKVWIFNKTFDVSKNTNILKLKRKYYILDMFPYPSGTGLHVGHPRGYLITDVLSRIKRMKGSNVLHPIGWDAFGLPTERTAQRLKLHPRKLTLKNISVFKQQLKNLGFSYSWSVELCTSDIKYYKWTQWLFLKLYNCGLAYKKKVSVNWCSELKTVLANEEVKNGHYIETGDKVYTKYMFQWVLRITKYAKKLLQGLTHLKWPFYIKEMQYNWIGHRKLSEITLKTFNYNLYVKLLLENENFIFGISMIGIKIVNCYAQSLFKFSYKFSNLYIKTLALNNNKNICLFKYAIHPFTKKKIPVWLISNIKLDGFQVYTVVHSINDYLFFYKYKINKKYVIKKSSQKENLASFQAINSGFLNNNYEELNKRKLIRHLYKYNVHKILYISKLKDWLFARQRYWGEPFPLLYSGKKLRIIKNENLPIKLPLVKLYSGYTLKSRFYKNWSQNLAQGLKRETDTMPQWAGSCWYYLRYLDPQNKKQPWSLELEKYWLPVDLYVGGSEHAVLHLLYARFWHKVLYDCRLVHYPEPFSKLFNQGVVLATSYKDYQGKYYYYEDIYCKYNSFYLKKDGRCVKVKIEKMSKSKFNVYNPNSFIKTYGADAFRLHVLFLGPLDQSIIWHNQSIKRMFKTLWYMYETFCKAKLKNENLRPNFIDIFKQVNFNNLYIKFNINISLFMEMINGINKSSNVSIFVLKSIVKLFHPYIPFTSSELWQKLGEFSELSYENWDKFSYPRNKKSFMVLQLKGKVKERIEVSKEFGNIALFIKKSNNIRKYIKDKHIIKIIYISQRIINIIL